MKNFVINLIVFYRKVHNFFYLQRVPLLIYPDCKFYPTCSEYGIQAIRKDGVPKGLLRAGWRILRCNPWSRGGIDEV